ALLFEQALYTRSAKPNSHTTPEALAACYFVNANTQRTMLITIAVATIAGPTIPVRWVRFFMAPHSDAMISSLRASWSREAIPPALRPVIEWDPPSVARRNTLRASSSGFTVLLTFPLGDFAIQILLPAALNAQLIPGVPADPDYSTKAL